MMWVKFALAFLLLLVCVYFIFPDNYLKSSNKNIARQTTSYLEPYQFEDSNKFNNLYNCLENYKTLDIVSAKKHSYNFFVAGHAYGRSSEDISTGLYPKFYDNLREINNIQSIDFIVLTGDVVKHSTIKSWNIVKNQLSSLGIKTYIAPGNHDVGVGEDNPKRDVFKSMFGETYYYFYHKKDLFIVLDPNIDNGNISGNQLRFLNNLLKIKQKVNNIFVFAHQVIWYSDFFDGIVPNNYYPDPDVLWNDGTAPTLSSTTNYWSIIAPLLENQKVRKPMQFVFSQKTIDVYLIVGDVGDKINGSPLFCADKKNIKYIASGMGSGRGDNYLSVQVVDGIVSIMPVFLP